MFMQITFNVLFSWRNEALISADQVLKNVYICEDNDIACFESSCTEITLSEI